MKKASHKIRNIVLWSLVILGGMALLAWAFTPKPILVEITEVRRGPYDQLVIEEGKTRAREIFEIPSPVSGNLERVEVHAGDQVQEGDVLAVVEWPRPWEIKSPVAGRVLRVKRESGGPIERGMVIMEVADPSNLEVVAEVLTDDAIQIKAGAPVKIESWGGCEALEGKVRLVEPAAFTKISALGVEEQRVRVIIDITSPKEKCEGMA
ncbi:MAG: HlyD family efflux transporter periplasmic adaptor subunit, partial [bacterium]|nr:HlyD family efflux transporter periplasmic adaptor subunit [bacterium]